MREYFSCTSRNGDVKSLGGSSFFSSWSGGKDSCLALYHAIQHDGIPICVIHHGQTMKRLFSLPPVNSERMASSMEYSAILTWSPILNGSNAYARPPRFRRVSPYGNEKDRSSWKNFSLSGSRP